MNYKNRMKTVVSLSIFFLLIIIGSAFVLGASMGNRKDNSKMTLDDVRKLILKGDTLIMEDFIKFKGKDIGSGLYIMRYDLEGGYSLIVGSSSMTGSPMYVNLVKSNGDPFDKSQTIDIRYDDLEAFLENSSVPSITVSQGTLNKFVDIDKLEIKYSYSNSFEDDYKPYTTENEVLISILSNKALLES